MMKKLFLLFVICTATLLGCKNKKDDASNNDLYGTWKLTEMRYYDELDDPNDQIYAWKGEETIVTFTSDNRFTTEGYFVYDKTGLFTTISGTYKQQGQELNFYIDSEASPVMYMTIESLTSTQLLVSYEDSRWYYKFKKQ